MDDVLIRLFNERDIKFAYKQCRSEHWNHSLGSIERMLAYEPNGCFIVEVNGERVGHVFSISYSKVGWIGLLIVSKEHRRRCVGTLLMKHAMSYLQNIGVETIKLDAVPEIANLYRKLGFIDEFDSLRFMKINKKGGHAANSNMLPLRNDEIEEVAKFDFGYFGANRTKVLRRIYEDSQKNCFISRIESQIFGYIMFYEAEKGYRIGPWICNPSHPLVARELLVRCMETFEENAEVYVGVPEVNKTAVKILQDLGFRQYSKSIRMYFGKELKEEHVEGIFAIGGPEKG